MPELTTEQGGHVRDALVAEAAASGGLSVLARNLGFSQGALWQVSSGRTGPSYRLAAAIARRRGQPVEDLLAFGARGAPTPPPEACVAACRSVESAVAAYRAGDGSDDARRYLLLAMRGAVDRLLVPADARETSVAAPKSTEEEHPVADPEHSVVPTVPPVVQ